MSEELNRIIDNGIFRQDRDGIHYYDQSDDRNQEEEDLDVNDPEELELTQTLFDVSFLLFYLLFNLDDWKRPNPFFTNLSVRIEENSALWTVAERK